MLKAIIFDLDGTILINDKAYDAAFGTVLNSLGVSENEVEHTGGIGVKANWKKFIEKYNLDPNTSLDELEEKTQKEYLDNIDKITIREGFEELVADLKAHKMRIALATGNDKETTEKILEHFDIAKHFESVSTIYEAGRPKPEPDIFQLAAKRLGVENNECIVIEDSDAGIKSALNAGMPVVSVHDYTFSELTFEKLQSIYRND